MPITCRVANDDDASDIAAVQVESWRSAYRGILPDTDLAALSEAGIAQRWRQNLNDSGRRVWVASKGSEMAGFCSCQFARDADLAGKAGEVTAIYVRPSCWGLGTGRSLMRLAEAHFVEAALHRAVLWVLEGNQGARSFYERLGFGSDGERRLLSGSDSVMELRYQCRLGVTR